MPIRNKEKAREYFKEYMAKRRKGLTNSDVKPSSVLNPETNLLNQAEVKPDSVKPITKNVKPQTEALNPVKPLESNFVKPEKERLQPCSLSHYSFKELFKEATEQVRKDYQNIYQQYPESARKCFDCHNRERNYQIMRNLLDSYAKETKRLNR